MSESSKDIIHPVTISIVNTMNRIRELFIKGHYLPGLKLLHFQTLNMDPNDVDAELQDRLVKEILIIERMQSRTARAQHMYKRRRLYDKWYGQIQATLWAKGYYNQEKFKYELKGKGTTHFKV